MPPRSHVRRLWRATRPAGAGIGYHVTPRAAILSPHGNIVRVAWYASWHAIPDPKDAAVTEPQLPALAAHEIHLFLRVSRPVREWNRLAIALGDLAPPAGQDAALVSWVPASIRPALATRYAADPVWEQTSIEVGADLHAHLRRLVSGGDAKLSVAFHASARTIRLLTKADLYPVDVPRDAREGFQLVWVPTNAARGRMAAHGVTEAQSALPSSSSRI